MQTRGISLEKDLQSNKKTKLLNRALYAAMFLVVFVTLAASKIKFDSFWKIFLMTVFSVTLFTLLIVMVSPHCLKYDEIRKVINRLIMAAILGALATNIFLYQTIDALVLSATAVGIAFGLVYVWTTNRLFKIVPNRTK